MNGVEGLSVICSQLNLWYLPNIPLQQTSENLIAHGILKLLKIRCWIRNKGTFLSSAEMKRVINTTLNIKSCTIECKLAACGLSDNFVDGFGKSRITLRRGSYTSVDQTSLTSANGLFDTHSMLYKRPHGSDGVFKPRFEIST